ncbi:DNA-binding protein [Gilbertella persicaria]|uniref:DNA-binding protein n=1 Tax=Gilbertella persicaria TaxID=101096 RepID=UPI00221EB693|nr:DNA-binding protein [Gilbertella persicaria]KAI8047967.1 DNA-binding protein [Gilbertella persicaria]
MSHEQIVIRKDIIDLTCEFLETWFHQILYKRNIYPRAIFETQKKFQVPVKVATHPDVQEYIASFVQSCHPLLEKGLVKFISLTVLKDDNVAEEKFVFEINSILNTVDIPLEILQESESIYTMGDLEQHLRACLIKLGSVVQESTDNDRRFALSIETVQDGYPQQGTIDWIPAGENHHPWAKLIPLKSAPMDLFRFNTFVMEASNNNSNRKGKERCP